jgi:hypothetical protein
MSHVLISTCGRCSVGHGVHHARERIQSEGRGHLAIGWTAHDGRGGDWTGRLRVVAILRRTAASTRMFSADVLNRVISADLDDAPRHETTQ